MTASDERRLKLLLREALVGGKDPEERVFREHLDEEMISALVAGGLSAEEREELEHHLRECPSCRGEVAQWRRRMAGPGPLRLRWAAAALVLLLAGAAAWFGLGGGAGEGRVDLQTLADLYRGRPAPGPLAYSPGIYPVLPRGRVRRTRPRFAWIDCREYPDPVALQRRFAAAGQGPAWPGIGEEQTLFLTLRYDSGGMVLLGDLPVTGRFHRLSRELESGEYSWWISTSLGAAPPGKIARFTVPSPVEILEMRENLEKEVPADADPEAALVYRYALLRNMRSTGKWFTLEEDHARALWPRLPEMAEVELAGSLTLAEAFLNDRAEFYRQLGVDPLASWYRWLSSRWRRGRR